MDIWISHKQKISHFDRIGYKKDPLSERVLRILNSAGTVPQVPVHAHVGPTRTEDTAHAVLRRAVTPEAVR